MRLTAASSWRVAAKLRPYWETGPPKPLAILEFDNLQQVHAWLASPELIALNDIRSRSSNVNMVIVEGL